MRPIVTFGEMRKVADADQKSQTGFREPVRGDFAHCRFVIH